MGFLKRLAYRPELSSLAGLLRIRLLARWCYFRFVAPRGIMKVEVRGIKARFRVKAPGEVRTIEGATLGGEITWGEREVLEGLMDVLRGGGVFYDVGANFGVFSVLLGKVLGENGQVIAFEPDTRNFARLQENLKLNQVENVKCFRKALSDKSGQASLLVSKDEPWTSSLSISPRSGIAGSEVVEIVEGDQFVAEERLPPPLAVKIDVEGHEATVIRGLQKTLSDPACKLVMLEIHLATWMATTGFEPILELMRSLGFQEIKVYPRGFEQQAICRKG
jgi:FkbM family methyltransferase